MLTQNEILIYAYLVQFGVSLLLSLLLDLVLAIIDFSLMGAEIFFSLFEFNADLLHHGPRYELQLFLFAQTFIINYVMRVLAQTVYYTCLLFVVF
jgi:hypothetical protein